MSTSVEEPHLLIVEDDRAIRDMLVDRLRGFALTTSTCQVECFERLDASEFDLVLLDLRLPKRATDMSPSNDVGIDILRQIRQRGLRKRGSTMPLPVVVMTAHGSEKISAKVLVEYGASDYVPKPFGQDDELEQKIERALKGAGGFGLVANSSSAVCLHFDPDAGLVRIESIAYPEQYQLLKVLIEVHAKDQGELRPWEEHRAIPGKDLAKTLDLDEQALRRRISRFRKQLASDFEKQLGRVILINDVIENLRRWNGYRLNPRKVHVFRQGPSPKNKT